MNLPILPNSEKVISAEQYLRMSASELRKYKVEVILPKFGDKGFGKFRLVPRTAVYSRYGR